MSKKIHWQKLHLDPENPRLPEDWLGSDKRQLVEYYVYYEKAEELVASMLENGYFEHEPLIVRRDGPDSFLVLEGNRRLAALMLAHGDPDVVDLLTLKPNPDASQLRQLTEIPCVIVDGPEEVRKLVGFKHIGGLKKWKPEAKARFILADVNRAYAAGVENPFVAVAREVGSNSQGIRNSYMAVRTLIWARDAGIPVARLQHDRFGVWLRCMNSPDIRKHIGLDLQPSYAGMNQAIENLNEPELREVIEDLTPGEHGRAVLGDSRDVTMYGNILQNPRARAALRTYGSLEVAKQVVRHESLPMRVDEISKICVVLLQEVVGREPSEELEQAVAELLHSVKALKASVEALRADD